VNSPTMRRPPERPRPQSIRPCSVTAPLQRGHRRLEPRTGAEGQDRSAGPAAASAIAGPRSAASARPSVGVIQPAAHRRSAGSSSSPRPCQQAAT